jgi:hypothetical protein
MIQIYQVGFQRANPTCHRNFASVLPLMLLVLKRLSVFEAARPLFPMYPNFEVFVVIPQHQP